MKRKKNVKNTQKTNELANKCYRWRFNVQYCVFQNRRKKLFASLKRRAERKSTRKQQPQKKTRTEKYFSHYWQFHNAILIVIYRIQCTHDNRTVDGGVFFLLLRYWFSAVTWIVFVCEEKKHCWSRCKWMLSIQRKNDTLKLKIVKSRRRKNKQTNNQTETISFSQIFHHFSFLVFLLLFFFLSSHSFCHTNTFAFHLQAQLHWSIFLSNQFLFMFHHFKTVDYVYSVLCMHICMYNIAVLCSDGILYMVVLLPLPL